MRFPVDTRLSPRLARCSESRGHNAEHFADPGLETLQILAFAQRATESSAAIITKDEDLPVHLLLHGGPAVVRVRIGNTRRAAVLRRFGAELLRIIEALEQPALRTDLVVMRRGPTQTAERRLFRS